MQAHKSMLPAYIIDQLRRRERARKDEEAKDQPRVEVPRPRPRRAEGDAKDAPRGVVIIELMS